MKPPPQPNPDTDPQPEIPPAITEPSLPVRQLILGAAGLVAFIALATLAVNAIGVERLQTAIAEAGPAAPLAYIALKALTYVFAPLTSGPIQMVSGTLFDNLWLGVLYTQIGEVIGGSISFWIARRFGRPAVRRFVGASGLVQVDQFYQTRMGGWRSLVIARLYFFSLWDFLSYAAGLAPVRFRTYLWVSALVGTIPTALYVWIGYATIGNDVLPVLLYALMGLVLVLPLLFRKQITRWF